jgi:hypothetical protein
MQITGDDKYSNSYTCCAYVYKKMVSTLLSDLTRICSMYNTYVQCHMKFNVHLVRIL